MMPDDQNPMMHAMNQMLMMQQLAPAGVEVPGMGIIPVMGGMISERPVHKPGNNLHLKQQANLEMGVCSVHGKKRGGRNLIDDGAGGQCCSPDFACQVGVGDGGPRKKFKICMHWQQGRCGKGSACTFAHGEEEIGQEVDLTAVPDGGKLVLSGDWYCPGCGDHQFARNTECRKCGAPNPQGQAGAGPGGAWGQSQIVGNVAPGEPTMKCAIHGLERGVMSLTSDGAGGVRCKPGNECNAVQIPPAAPAWGGAMGASSSETLYTGKKWIMCKYFQQGACQKGTACTFAHSEEDIPTGKGGTAGKDKGGGKGSGGYAPY